MLSSTSTSARRRRVTYFYEPNVGSYFYGPGHPMKPHRIVMAHSLVVNYGLHNRLEVCRPFPADPEDVKWFHTSDYVDLLREITPENARGREPELNKFNFSKDCPVFFEMFKFCRESAGGSIGSAVKLNRRDADIAITWAGGLHHAKKSEASGFCYVNDVVLGILELLKVHKRVLYVDIDIHHGDGVEEAFYCTNRVMTVSFHQHGAFPGTGDIKDIGAGMGKNYALNVPLLTGLTDDNFRYLFEPLITKVRNSYQPDVIVLQSGAGSLAGDRLGGFNLSVKGHADCLRFLMSLDLPLMVLGGGGYTMRNVARCWCYETAVAVGVEPENKLPYHQFYQYYGPDYLLHVEPSQMENLNTDKNLENLRNKLFEQVSELEHAPSVPFQTTPPTAEVPEEREPNMEERHKQRLWNHENFYLSDADLDKDWDTINEPKVSGLIDESFEDLSSNENRWRGGCGFNAINDVEVEEEEEVQGDPEPDDEDYYDGYSPVDSSDDANVSTEDDNDEDPNNAGNDYPDEEPDYNPYEYDGDDYDHNEDLVHNFDDDGDEHADEDPNNDENDYDLNHDGNENLPIINALPEAIVETDNEDPCPICLENLEIGDWIRQLPCLHKHHTDCIDRWLKINLICPVCKNEVNAAD